MAVIFGLLAVAVAACAADDDLATIKRRIREGGMGSTRSSRAARAAGEGAGGMRPDGSWADIDYSVTDRENWTPSAHVFRLQAMAVAYRRAADAGKPDAELRAKVLAGLGYWFKADPHCTNWWWNEIGVPQTIGYVMLLVEEDLTPELKRQGIEVLRRSKWKTWTGQNLVWGTTIQVMRGCLEDSPAVVGEAYGRMYQEIRVAKGHEEGIQADWSFHQHGDLLYSGGYGAGFTTDCARFVDLAKDTRFAVPAGKLGILESYVLDGQQWMVRGDIWDYSVTGRELVRPGKSAAGLGRAVEMLAKFSDGRQKELADFAARLRGDEGAPPLVGNRQFWKSDYMSHSRAGYLTSVRMYSERTLNTDGYTNGENKKSHHLADGATYIYRTGDEYKDIFPVWEWHRVPGTTCEQGTPLVPEKVHYRGKTKFVGGASDGTYGVAAQDLKSGGLTAKKAWFYFDDEFVCLGAGISCSTDNPVCTSVNQCLLKGNLEKHGSAAALHDSVGYVVFPGGGGKVEIRGEKQVGSWHEISPGSSREISLGVFSMWIDHGRRPKDAGYAYAVLPGADGGRMDVWMTTPPVEVVSNTPRLQAVKQTKLGMIEAVFWEAGAVDGGEGFKVSVDRPCVVLVRREGRGGHVAVANPVNEAMTVEVGIGRERTIKFDLPGGEDAGRSVVKDFTEAQ